MNQNPIFLPLEEQQVDVPMEEWEIVDEFSDDPNVKKKAVLYIAS